MGDHFDLSPLPFPAPAPGPRTEPPLAEDSASAPWIGPGGGSAEACGELFGGLFDDGTILGDVWNVSKVGGGKPPLISPVSPSPNSGDRKNEDQGQKKPTPEPKPTDQPKKPYQVPNWDGSSEFEPAKPRKKAGVPSISPKAIQAIRDAGALAMIGVIMAALLDPEPATKLALLGLSAALIVEILDGSTVAPAPALPPMA